MRKIILSLAVFVASLFPLLYTAPAQAQNARSFVSHTGSDSNTCTEASPCLTFLRALSQTANQGEIDCLDGGFFGNTGGQITISVTIDCHAANASVWNANTGDGIDINVPGGVVVLRGLNIYPNYSGGSDIGIKIAAAQTVYIEDCVVMGFLRGIDDVRTAGGTQLFVKNTVVRANLFNTNTPGIALAAAAKNTVVLENVQSWGNAGYGVAVATGNVVLISRSVMSGNGIGIEADPGASVFVDNTEISHNSSYGVYASGTVVLANSDIAFNTSSISGPTTSYGNNRFFGNGGGTAPTPAGGVSTDLGQQ